MIFMANTFPLWSTYCTVAFLYGQPSLSRCEHGRLKEDLILLSIIFKTSPEASLLQWVQKVMSVGCDW